MTLWWVFRPAGAGTPIVVASQERGGDCQEGPLDDASNAELRAFLRVLPVIPFGAFVLRWTPTEYATLLQKRAAAISLGNVVLAQQWDVASAVNSVDLNSSAAQNFKAAMVSNNILTQARADVIFS